MENKILILDIETTGTNPSVGKIVEIALISLNLETAEVKPLYNKVVHEPGISKAECDKSWIVENSTLTTDMIRHSPSLIVEHQEIQQIINNHPLGCTAFNHAFDFGFMALRGFVFPKKLDCLMYLSTEILKLPPTEKMIKYRPETKYKNPNAQEAFLHFFPNSGYIELHRAGDDAEHEAQVAYKLFELGVLKIN